MAYTVRATSALHWDLLTLAARRKVRVAGQRHSVLRTCCRSRENRIEAVAPLTIVNCLATCMPPI